MEKTNLADIYLKNTYMDKGKTTKILSGGVRIGKDGKPHKWSKIHGYKTQKVTDDNWMDYGMPDDEPDIRKIKNESRYVNKKLVRLTEGDLHRIVKESVNRILSEEVDTGQVMSAHERNMMRYTSPREEEIRRKIRKIRAMIGDYEDENKDTSELVKQLQRLKKEAGYC